MRVKYFVGKDRTTEVKEKRTQRSGPFICRTCGDELVKGFCTKCVATIELYRDVDNRRFAEFQRQHKHLNVLAVHEYQGVRPLNTRRVK